MRTRGTWRPGAAGGPEVARRRHAPSVIVSFCPTQQGWSLSVELVIGGRGIRQRTQKNAAVSAAGVQATFDLSANAPNEFGPLITTIVCKLQII